MADITNSKKYVDVAYLKEFWERIKLLPTADGTKYTVTLGEGKTITTNPDTIVGHLEQLYALANDVKTTKVQDTGIKGKSIKVTEDKDKDGNPLYTIEIDPDYAEGISTAIAAAAEAYKGQTTLSADNTDLTTGDVTITLGGEGSDGSTITLSQIDLSDFDDVLHVGDAEISGDGTIELTKTTQTGSVTITGENGSTANVTVDATDIFDAIDELGDNAEKLNAEGTSTDGTYVNATVTAQTSTDGTGSVTVSVDDSKLDETFLKIDDANNDVVSISDVTLAKVGTGTTYSGTMTYTDNAGASQSATISFDSADFIKDAFLDSVEVGTGDDEGKLIFTWNTDADKEVTKITIGDFIKAYTAADKSIDITNNTIKVNLDGGYLKLNTNGIGVDTTKIQGYATTEAKTGDNNLASKKYVDDSITTAKVGYSSTTLDISESTTDGKTTVTLDAPIATWSDDDADDDFPFN